MKRLSRSTRRKIGAFLATVGRSMVDGRLTPGEGVEILRAGTVMIEAIRADLTGKGRGGEE